METSLKHRLIGAGVLVALAVIFLPMLVKGPAPDSGAKDVSLHVPEAPQDGFETRDLPLVGDAGPATPVPVQPAPGTSVTAPDASAQAPANNPDAADLAVPAPAVAAGNYAVTFGAYASAGDADKVIARLRQAGLPGFSTQDTINGRPAWRVRVGPYADQAQAEAARLSATKIRSDVKLQVIALDATPMAAPAATASTPAPMPATEAPRSAVTTAPASAPPPARVEPAKPATPAVADAVKSAPAKPAQTKPEPAKVEAPKPAPARVEPAKPAVSTPKAPAASGVGFAVQLGAFGAAADANALRDKARAAGFSAFVEQVNTDKGPLNRVRIGPVATRDEAEKLKASVAAKLGVSGMVRPHP